MSRDQVVVLAFVAGCTLYAFGPTWVRAAIAWFRPEPLAPFSRYQDIDS